VLSINPMMVVREFESVKLTDTRLVVQPSREAGISEQPEIHPAAKDCTWTLDAFDGTAARISEILAKI
jgi:hypothetical protein